MADVRITYSPDRATAAKRLRDAISAAGYDVSSVEISDVEELVAAEAGHQKGTATLLIWSRSLALSALRPGMLRQLRQQAGLIEVSPDGVAPQAKDGDNHVILISGWRGQPFHPGWQRIASELERLCGPPTQVSEPPVGAARAEAPAAPQSVHAETRTSTSPSRSGKWAVALLAAIALFGAGFGASSWIESRNSEPEQPRAAKIDGEQAKRRSVATAPPTPVAANVPAPAPPRPSALTSPAPSTTSPAAGQPAAAAAPAQAAGQRAKASGTEKKRDEPRSTKSRSRTRGETKRYSRANSEVMRQFCEGSGRSTPQCRTFLRSVPRNRR